MLLWNSGRAELDRGHTSLLEYHRYQTGDILKNLLDIIQEPLVPKTKLKTNKKNNIEKKTIDLALNYENHVFDYLQEIGFECRRDKILIDGIASNEDGDYLVEVKYRMNWGKACQAQWQISEYIRRNAEERKSIKGAIVFFEQFSSSWNNVPKYLGHEKGWSLWYSDHAITPCDFKTSLVRFNREDEKEFKVSGFPRAGLIGAAP